MHTITQTPPAGTRNPATRRLALWGTFLVLGLTGVAAEAATLTAVQSRKVHGAGTFDVTVDTSQSIAGAVTVESREIGATGHQIVFQFDAPVTSHGTPSAFDETGAAIGTLVPLISGNDVVITLTGIPDNKRIRIVLPGVNGGGDAVAAMGFLVGDVGNSRTVSAADVSQMKSRAGQGVDISNVRFDLNASGAITAADISAVKSRPPRTLPDAPVLPGFTLQPANASIVALQAVQFTVTASGAPVPILQWQFSIDSGATWSDIPGANGSALHLVGALSDSGRQYRAVATNGAGSVNSNAATLTVNVAPGIMVGAPGGTVNGDYGAQIIVPAGALAGTVEIRLLRDSANSPALSLPDVEAVGAIYEMTPHGTAFAQPVTLRIPFDPAQLPDDAIPVLYKAETGGSFTALPTTVDGNFLVTTVTNFSWILAAYSSTGSSGVSGSTKPRAVYALQPTAGSPGIPFAVASFRINSTTGALTGPTSTGLVGSEPISVVAHPSRRFLYVTHAGSTTVNNILPNSVATYRLNTLDGQITGAAQGSVSTGAPIGYKPTMPAIHPSGKFLYVMNFGSASNNGGGDISLFTINGVTGALTLSPSVTTGNGAQPMGIAFNRLGTFAYVLYGGTASANTFSSQVKVYSVHATTGVLTGPLSGAAAGALGGGAWSIAVDASGKFAYVATLFTDEVIAYSINSVTGALTNLGSTMVTAGSKLASLATDSYGRFLIAGRQQPWLSKNLLSYQINAISGSLTPANNVLTACSGGSCVGPLAVVAEPQGQYVFAIDSAVTSTLSAFSVNAATGALTATGAAVGIVTPRNPGVSYPITFGVTGASPAWQNNCTYNCALPHTGSGSGGGGGGPNPNPPTSHFLTVTQPIYIGFVYSSPAGIDYGPPTISNPIPPSDFRAEFPVNASVQLCTFPPPPSSQAYDIEWTGSCSGTGVCTSVTMNSDKDCQLNFKPVSGR
ncbi:MAG: beta-propeller fold lactonase family protein [Betaproteobacteria bacterium]|nr:beta-propeller fold lactonase family protein [Betaproteobacteria bacterium]